MYPLEAPLIDIHFQMVRDMGFDISISLYSSNPTYLNRTKLRVFFALVIKAIASSWQKNIFSHSFQSSWGTSLYCFRDITPFPNQLCPFPSIKKHIPAQAFREKCAAFISLSSWLQPPSFQLRSTLTLEPESYAATRVHQTVPNPAKV